MEIKKNLIDENLTVELVGRLDAVTAIDLEKDLRTSISSIKSLTFDLAKLDYIASAGLRILLKYQKTIDKNGGNMTIKNVKPDVKEVLDMTGFSDFLNIVDDTQSKRISLEF